MNCMIHPKRMQTFLKFLANQKGKKATEVNDLLLLRSLDGCLELITTNIFAFKISYCQCDIESGLVAVVNYSQFKQVISELKNHFEIIVDANHVAVREGSKEFRIGKVSKEKFPAVPSVEYNQTQHRIEDIRRAIDPAVGFAGDDASVYNFTCVSFNGNSVVATDGICLIEVKYDFGINGLVKADAVKAVSQIPIGPVYIGQSDSFVGFRGGWAEVLVRKEKGNFPKYETVFPTSPNVRVECKSGDVISLVKSVYSKDNKEIVLMIDKKDLVARLNPSRNGEKSEFEFRAKCVSNDKVKVGISSHVLHKVAQVLPDNTVTIHMTKEAEKPSVVSPLYIAYDNRRIVFMPLRID